MLVEGAQVHDLVQGLCVSSLVLLLLLLLVMLSFNKILLCIFTSA